ncbi:MAG: HAMP domain-containing sensor histidine kinase [Thermoanaerobaculia bacterium]
MATPPKNLLALARSSTGAVAGGGRPTTTSIDLHAAVARALELVRETCSDREIEVVNAVPAPSPALAPPADLDLVLSNLAQNSALHAPRQSRTQVRFVSTSGALVWTNFAPDLDAADLPHLFDPFWRKNRARSGGEHAGLGLSLVRALVRRWGGEASASLADGELRIEISGLTPVDPAALPSGATSGSPASPIQIGT